MICRQKTGDTLGSYRMKWLQCLVLSTCFVLTVASSSGQSLNELRKQKEKTAAEIEYINNLLKETNQNARKSLNRLAVLEKQIILQDNLINNITREIDVIEEGIKQSSFKIDSLTQKLQEVKDNYAALIRYARRNQDSNNQLLYILSADNFNQAYKRFIYLRQYADYRRKQAYQIDDIKNSITAQLNDYNNRKQAKQSLLASRIDETKKIEQQKEKQSEVYTELQQKEKDLKKKLENQRRAEARLQAEIEKVIAEEARKAALKSAKEPGSVISKEEIALSGDFASNRGKFPWPVQNGLITDRFGEHPHAILKYVKVRNSGIDITTRANENARAIFKGEVTRVISISGGNLAVIIRHGSYLTVYANLSEVFVRAGQKVDVKQEIGKVFTDSEEDKTVLKFQLWHQNTKLDPEEWIQR